MKYRRGFVKVSALMIGVGALLGLGSRADAVVVVTARQIGSAVEFSGGGTLNLAELLPVTSANWFNGFVNPSLGLYQGAGALAEGTTPGTVYSSSSFVGPLLFGPGINLVASLVSGDFGGIRGGNLPGVLVSSNYVSGAPLFGTSTFPGETLLSMGLTPGVYEWSWGTENPDSYRLIIGDATPSAVPAPLPVLGAAAALGFSRKLRRRIKNG